MKTFMIEISEAQRRVLTEALCVARHPAIDQSIVVNLHALLTDLPDLPDLTETIDLAFETLFTA